MSSPPRKSAFRAPPSRVTNERNSPASPTEKAPKTSSASGAPRRVGGSGKGTLQTGEVLKRRLERLKQNSNSQNGAKPQSGSRSVQSPTGEKGSRTGASSNNNRVSSPQSTPTPVNTSTPLFVRRMSDNDPRRNLIKSSVYSKRKASLPAQSPRSSFSIGPSPLAATDTKPKRTIKHPNSEAYGSVSQTSTSRENGTNEQAKSKKTRPKSSSPRTSIGLSSRDKTSRTTPRDSDLSRTSTPDRMIRVISQESINNEAHIPSTNTKGSSHPEKDPSQRDDLSGCHPGGEGSSRGRRNNGNIQDGAMRGKEDPKHSYVSDVYDEDNSTNVELELRSLKSESDNSIASERTRRKRNIAESTTSEKSSKEKSSGGRSKKSPRLQDQNEHNHDQEPAKHTAAVTEKSVHQHNNLEDSSPRHENNLEVIDLEIKREVKGESKEESRRNFEVVSDDDKKKQRSSLRSRGTDEERMSDGLDPEVKGERPRRGSGFKGQLDGRRRGSKSSDAEDQDHQATAMKGRDDQQRRRSESLEVKGHSPRPRSRSRSKSRDADDEADKLTRSIDGRQATSPTNKVSSPSPRREEPTTADKRQMIRQRSSELAVMAKRLEEKAKEMKNRPTPQWKRTTTGTDNVPMVPKSTTPVTPTTVTTTTLTTTSPPEQPRPATSTGVIPDVEQMKRMMVKQRARELAEGAQRALVRDREVEHLKQELEALKKEMEIGRQDKLIEGDLQRSLSTGSSTLKLKALEDSNSSLKDELQKLQDDSRSVTQKLEVEVSQQRKSFEALERDLCEERQKSNQLALDLQHAVNQNAFLTKQLGDLHRKLSLLDQVLEECRQLREDFSDQRQILHSTIAERDWLRESVIKLNSDIALMQASEEKRKQLERDYEEALRDLENRQSEFRRLQMAQDEVMTQNRDVVTRLEHKVQDLEKQWLETRQNSGRNAAELSGLRQQTHSQLQTLASTSGPSRSTLGQNPGSSHGSTTVRSKEAEKEDWKRIAEEALVTRAPSQATATASGPKLKAQDAADSSQGSETSQRSAAKNGQADSLSEPGDLLDDLSDKIDQVLLNKLHHASVSSGPISKLAVFIARYNYDPSQDSPNDNSDSELPLTAGDYIYVYGDPDEDGFYEGELMDGRRGLVPCNFIERIAEENLPDFMQYNGSQADEDPLSDMEFNSEDSDARRSNMNHFSGDLAFARAQSDHPSDLEDIPEVDEDDDNHHAAGRRGDEGSLASFSDFSSDVSYVVPCPRKLTLDRQLKHSVIMSWVAPDTVTLQEILEFRVYVDGQYRTATKQGAKTRALVENVEPTGTYRISVRTVTGRGMSEEAACMLVIGRDASMAPTNLKASNVGPSSANISWLPANTNLPHVVSANGEEVRTVKPGIYKYSLSGLQPLSVYRINVRAKSRRQTAVVDNPQANKNSIEIEFKTLPGGLPDAPLDVQVRQSTNDSMVSVEWLPVTITTSSLSNGAVIMGYAVFVGSSKVAETMSPTADRVNIPKSKLRMLSAKELVVRTLSPNGYSNDSVPAKVPLELLEEQRKDKMAGKIAPGGKVKAAMYANADEEDSSSSSTSRSLGGRRSSSEESSQKMSQKGAMKADGSPREDGVPLKPIMKTEKASAILRESDYMSDSDRSELSDIQEEVEEELSEFGNASIPGLSDSSEGVRSSGRRRNEKKNVQETFQVLQYNTKQSLDFDTDPEVESLNKPDKVVPIPIIRSQRDYERETEQSPHNPVVEPVPWKPAKTVPQIEITKDANNEHLKAAAAAAASRKTDLYTPEKRTEVIRTSPVSSASNSLPMASPRSDPRGQSRTPGQRSSSQWNASSVASSNSEIASYSKNYDAKSNNDRHHHQADGRPHSEESSHRRSDSSGVSERNRHSRHSDSLRTPDSSLSLQRSSRGSRSEETFGDEDDEEGFSGSEPEELFDDGTIRYFIAIFDYNPAIMSPNIDGAEEELFLKEGDVLKIIGDKDSDGFFVGEMNGRRGYVPCNMVEEIEGPEQTSIANATKRAADNSQGHDRSRFNDSLNTTGSSQGPVVNMYDGLPSNGQLVLPKESTPHRMRALFDYNPQELSPNPDLDMELSFRQGDYLIVYGEMDEDGFFMGELRGKRGLVPSNFLEDVSDIDSSTTSQSYSPAFSRNKENKHQTQQSTKDKYAVPAQQQENGEAQYHGSEVTPVISDTAEQNSITSTPEHTKKKKGLLSKGKALFKKLGSSDNKQKHK